MLTQWLKVINTVHHSEFPNNPFCGSALGTDTLAPSPQKDMALGLRDRSGEPDSKLGQCQGDRKLRKTETGVKGWTQPAVAMEAKTRFWQHSEDTVLPPSRLHVDGQLPAQERRFGPGHE